MSEIFRVPEARCPACEAPLDAGFTSEEDRRPVEGDYTVCLYCTAVLRFNENHSLRLATSEEVEEDGVLADLHTSLQIMRMLPNAKS